MCQLRKSIVTRVRDKAQGFESQEKDAPVPVWASMASQIIHTWPVSMFIESSQCLPPCHLELV